MVSNFKLQKKIELKYTKYFEIGKLENLRELKILKDFKISNIPIYIY